MKQYIKLWAQLTGSICLVVTGFISVFLLGAILSEGYRFDFLVSAGKFWLWANYVNMLAMVYVAFGIKKGWLP